MILGLSLTQIIKGMVKFVQHPEKEKPYTLHLAWAFYLLVILVHFWWWEFRLHYIKEWVFTHYIFVVFYIAIFYLLAALLFPDDIKEYDGYKSYFFSRRKWFFLILAATFIIDVGDTYIKGKEYLRLLGPDYYLRIVSHVLLCIIAIFTTNRWYHVFLIVFFILFEIFWIAKEYMNFG